MVRPADFPAPFKRSDYITAPTDPEDERIEVGVLVVGGGPAGLACAIRFGQLLEENPDVAEQLGEVPLAVLEKGKQPGSHLLSGAVLNPRSIKTLFGDDFDVSSIPSYGEVPGEAVYVLMKGRQIPIPPPPPMRNHGNLIVSISRLGRWMAEQAEELGAMMLPETAAERLLIDGNTVVGVRTGDKGRGLTGEELANYEPGNDIVAKVTVLAEGTQGHLTNLALDHFDLKGNDPQVWEIGVKEVWKVAKPLEKIIHTMGWPLRTQAKYREFGGSFIYPMGDDMLTIGMVIGLDYRDVELSPHDVLQEFKTHPLVRPLLEGGERLEWGAKTIPGGGYHSLPKRLYANGLLMAGDGVGMVNVPTLKGIHYAIEAGRLAAESAFKAVQGEEVDHTALATYDDAVRSSFIVQDLHEVRDMRQVFGRGFFVGGALAGAMTLTKGKVHIGGLHTEPDESHPLLRTNRADSYPAPDGKLTFDKLSSVFASGNKTRDDQPDHIKLQHRVDPDVAQLWFRMCPAHVYVVGEKGADGLVEVEVSPSNCVQCGAISAKGGRLTPPEGGSGPEYTTT
jgi:electron-transferring-flavoprotein dehydrogenase